ncbi:MAG TPA: enolase C-terminal domain-like protein [Solirubrobacteraceae bacterium]|jgi:L-alanine-DL-glutamate epimerase-like enolase superfamily enzyme|nr:enolase C-terminal domain-like protein [Solirubrobacteraceae bacterium]
MAELERLDVQRRTVPTDAPESDGTLAWDSTTAVIVEVTAVGVSGLGWTYADGAAAEVVEGKLASALDGCDLDCVGACWLAMRRAVRNDGDAGLAACAISAVDIALWDRFARARELPLALALGAFRTAIGVYGSGGFCTYDDARLTEQLGGWAADGMAAVKMKVGADPASDPRRVRVAREAIGPDTELYLDANGAWPRHEAVHRAHELHRAADGIGWLEEPVSSQDLHGLRAVRGATPAGVPVAAGEYLWTPEDAQHMLAAEAVDVLQADATRCLGLTGYRAIGALAAAHGLSLSAHCAPALHAHAACSVQRSARLEYFHDHVRLERRLFEGAPEPEGGVLAVDRTRLGHGLSLRG